MRVTDASPIAAAHEAGVRIFDTAHAYGNEALVGNAVQNSIIITKGGMARPGGAWRADGRAASVQRDAEAGVAALGRVPDLFLIHAPDPRVTWSTTVRALGKVKARNVGVCNVTLRELDEAIDLAPIAAVQVAWNGLDDSSVRSGVIARCFEKGIAVIAHSPLGGPRHVKKLLALPALNEVAARHGVSPAAIALAALLDVHPSVVVIPGARTAAAAREVVTAAQVQLTDEDRAVLHTLPALRPVKSKVRSAPTSEGELVLLMGLQGAGKSTLARGWVDRGYENLNRDVLGKGLKDVAKIADEKLTLSTQRLVLDNTYVTRASRSQILDVAAKHGVGAHGVWVDVPLRDARLNVVWRMLEAHGRLLSPPELKNGKDNTFLPPMALLRMLKDLELPTRDEGFTSLEVRPFVRSPREGGAGQLVAGVDFEAACAHMTGPPVCWCRPPLPGILLALAHARGLDPAKCEVVGTMPIHRAMAEAIGAAFHQT